MSYRYGIAVFLNEDKPNVLLKRAIESDGRVRHYYKPLPLKAYADFGYNETAAQGASFVIAAASDESMSANPALAFLTDRINRKTASLHTLEQFLGGEA